MSGEYIGCYHRGKSREAELWAVMVYQISPEKSFLKIIFLSSLATHNSLGLSSKSC